MGATSIENVVGRQISKKAEQITGSQADAKKNKAKTIRIVCAKNRNRAVFLEKQNSMRDVRHSPLRRLHLQMTVVARTIFAVPKVLLLLLLLLTSAESKLSPRGC